MAEQYKPAWPIPRGPFTLWRNHGHEGWSWTDYPTLKEAIEGERYGEPWVVTKAVNYVPTEVDE